MCIYLNLMILIKIIRGFIRARYFINLCILLLLRFRDSAYRTRQNDYNKAQKRGIIASKEFELHMGASLVAPKRTRIKQSIQNNWLYNQFHSESGHQIHINGPPRRSVFRFRTPRFKRSASKSILPNSTRFSPHHQQFAGISQFGKICS